jgi:hypothetical protein
MLFSAERPGQVGVGIFRFPITAYFLTHEDAEDE